MNWEWMKQVPRGLQAAVYLVAFIVLFNGITDFILKAPQVFGNVKPQPYMSVEALSEYQITISRLVISLQSTNATLNELVESNNSTLKMLNTLGALQQRQALVIESVERTLSDVYQRQITRRDLDDAVRKLNERIETKKKGD